MLDSIVTIEIYTFEMNVGLFGTSADPPTIAHQEIIKWLGGEFDCVAVWAADNPFKTHGASLAQRSQMLELLVGELDRSVGVYPNLSSQRTLETVATARKIWSEANFGLTIGADLIPQLPKWYRVNELLAQVKLIIVPRAGITIAPADLQILTDLGAKMAIAPLTTPAVSSTEIRKSHSIQGLTPAIAKYIHQHQLYQG